MRCNNSEWNTESFETNENIQEYQFLPEQSGLSNPRPPKYIKLYNILVWGMKKWQLHCAARLCLTLNINHNK